MATVFDAIAQSIGVALGADQTVGGYIAGVTFTIVIIIILEWAIGDEEKAGNIFLISVGAGVIFSGLFGWFPLWVPFLFGLFIIFLLVNPFSNRGV